MRGPVPTRDKLIYPNQNSTPSYFHSKHLLYIYAKIIIIIIIIIIIF
jgi:hypothetical protein